MKRLIQALLLLGITLSLSSCGYNNMVEMSEGVDKQWANVEAQYQRRADLVPQLVSTVKGAADFEKSTLKEVVEARSKATSMSIDPSKLDQATLDKFQANQNQLSSSLSRLLVVVEKYPELKANANFRDLQVQLEGTENRIATARTRYNDMVGEYNAYIKKFPRMFYSSSFGFDKKPYFQSSAGAEQAPEVDFSDL